MATLFNEAVLNEKAAQLVSSKLKRAIRGKKARKDWVRVHVKNATRNFNFDFPNEVIEKARSSL